MSSVWTRLQLPDGTIELARPGSLIGRHVSATVRINDPRLSEVHALISLRGRQLKILSQRHTLHVDGKPCAEAVLQPGQQITLAAGMVLRVVDVSLPASVLALELSGQETVELSAPVYSLLAGSKMRLVASYLPGARMYLWSNDDGWSLELDGETRPLSEGDRWQVDGQELALLEVPLQQAATHDTRASRMAPPMRIVARFETVHIHRDGWPPVVLSGILARIITELAAFEAPVSWAMMADLIWPGDTNQQRKRQNWDRTTRRLRRKLRSVGLPDNLVRADGHGNVELLLRESDTLIDES